MGALLPPDQRRRQHGQRRNAVGERELGAITGSDAHLPPGQRLGAAERGGGGRHQPGRRHRPELFDYECSLTSAATCPVDTTEYSKITNVGIELWVDADNTDRVSELNVATGVFLRNQNEGPSVAASWTQARDRAGPAQRLGLHRSRGSHARYFWFEGTRATAGQIAATALHRHAARHRVEGVTFFKPFPAGTAGQSKPFFLLVRDPGCLISLSAAINVTVPTAIDPSPPEPASRRRAGLGPDLRDDPHADHALDRARRRGPDRQRHEPHPRAARARIGAERGRRRPLRPEPRDPDRLAERCDDRRRDRPALLSGHLRVGRAAGPPLPEKESLVAANSSNPAAAVFRKRTSSPTSRGRPRCATTAARA